ncbi:MAG: hypothetical protein ACSHXK_07290 [Oceanococcus sp.]
MSAELPTSKELKGLPLLASGDYHYWYDGSIQAVQEPWQLHQSGTGFVLSGKRIVNARTCFEVVAEYSNKRRCTGLDLSWIDANGKQNWQYRQQTKPQQLAWRKEAQDWKLTEATPGARLFPLLRAAAGPLVRELSKQPHVVIVPTLHDPDDTDEFLKPSSSQRYCEQQSSANHYRYFGGEYGEMGSEYWLNTQGLMTSYEWKSAQGLWRVELQDAYYAPGFRRF